MHCLLLSGFRFCSRDKKTGIWNPGWPGAVLAGGVAALVVFVIYGPLSTMVFKLDAICNVPMMQLGGSILVGMSGSQILVGLAQKKADQIIKHQLSEAVRKAGKRGPR